jgi:1-phosphofructokinase
MIYTVTFNPAIDYLIHTDEMKLGDVNRSKYDEMNFGGKGINVSIVLNELGIESRALGFVAGFTGEAIEKGIREMGIDTEFVHLKKGNSRINVKIKAGEETEINGQGPEIDKAELEQLFSKTDSLEDGDILILAGSIPGSLPSDVYEKILDRIKEKEIRVIVDARKDLLINVLKYNPFLIKPNNFELEEIFNVKLTSKEEIVECATKLQNMGARNVLVSMAEDGALLLDEKGKIYQCGVCEGIVKNSVGAGDSMVAGFVAGSLEKDFDYALKLGTACGGATAFSNGLGKRDEIYRLLETL